MRKEKFKFITSFCLGLAGLSTINASNPLFYDDVQKKALVQKIVAFENPDFLVTFFSISLACDFPLLESLDHAITPTLEDTTAFLKHVQNTPDFKVFGLSDDKVHSIQVLANNAFDEQGQLKTVLSMIQENLKVLPRLLVALTKLECIAVDGNQVSDLTPLKALTNLKILFLNCNQISELTPLKALMNLENLYLSENKISELTPLKALTNLQTLSLEDNQIVDFTPLKALTKLEFLLLNKNQTSDISSLKALTNLQKLSV